MSLVSNSLEGGTSGVGITSGNSGGASGTPLSNINLGVGTSAVYSNATAAHGTISALITGASGSSVFVGWDGYTAAQVAVRFYLNIPATPGVQITPLYVHAASSTVCRVCMTSTGKLFLQDSTTGVSIYSFGSALTTNTWYRVELAVDQAAGTLKCDYYLNDASTPVETGANLTGVNTGAAEIADIRVGSATTTTWAGSLYLDDIAVNDGTLTYIGAVPPAALYLTTSVSR